MRKFGCLITLLILFVSFFYAAISSAFGPSDPLVTDKYPRGPSIYNACFKSSDYKDYPFRILREGINQFTPKPDNVLFGVLSFRHNGSVAFSLPGAASNSFVISNTDRVYLYWKFTTDKYFDGIDIYYKVDGSIIRYVSVFEGGRHFEKSISLEEIRSESRHKGFNILKCFD